MHKEPEIVVHHAREDDLTQHDLHRCVCMCVCNDDRQGPFEIARHDEQAAHDSNAQTVLHPTSSFPPKTAIDMMPCADDTAVAPFLRGGGARSVEIWLHAAPSNVHRPLLICNARKNEEIASVELN